jgi:hypothetical protein
MRRPLIGAKEFQVFIGQGEQAQGKSWRRTKKKKHYVYERREKEEKNEI